VTPERLSIEEILSRLEAGPARIALLTEGFTAAQLHASPSKDEWSANDILAHVRSCQDVWSGVVAALQKGESPARNVVHPRQYVDRTGYLDLDFVPSLSAFAADRAELMKALSKLSPAAWLLTGPNRGWTLISGRTLVDQANGVVHHEAVHIEQIEAVVRALSR
jgi:hypothetical protein